MNLVKPTRVLAMLRERQGNVKEAISLLQKSYDIALPAAGAAGQG